MLSSSGAACSIYELHRPLVELDRDIALVQDARAANPVSIRTQRQGTTVSSPSSHQL
ncbi:hypothetical protein [Flindersiella endophytica]